VAIFAREPHREPFDADDLLLAEEIGARAAVCVDNARRYTREHRTSLKLQRSLLPRRLPDLAAVEVAGRYLPAGSVTEMAATGSTSSGCPVAGQRSSWERSPGTDCTPPQPWADCVPPYARSPTPYGRVWGGSKRVGAS
jgi:GAF domain-containing protein